MTTTPTAAARVSGTIKALEWQHVGTQPAGREYMTTCRTYKVTMWDDGSGNVLWFGQAGKPVRIGASTDEIGLAALQAAAQADYDARILAAIQPDPEQLSASEFMDFTRPLPDHPYDEQFDNQSDVEANPCGAWAAIQHMAHHLYATPSSAGTVSVEAAAMIAECAFDDRPRSRVGHHSHIDWEDGFRDGTNAAAAAMRALAGEGKP